MKDFSIFLTVLLLILELGSGDAVYCKYMKYDMSLKCQIGNVNGSILSEFEEPVEKTNYTRKIEFMDMKIYQLPEVFYTDFPRVSKIQLKRSIAVSALKKTFFEVVFPNVLWLKIIGSRVDAPEEIENDAFARLPNLESFFIMRVSLKTIREKAFQKNENLKLISITETNVKFLPRFLFWNLTLLETLHCTSNKIEYLPENLLSNNRKLKSINFSENQIKSLPNYFFANLVELEKVEFNWNEISGLASPELFLENKKLKSVRFSNNQIQRIPPHLLKLDILIDIEGNSCSNLAQCARNWNRTKDLLDNEEKKCAKASTSVSMSLTIGGERVKNREFPWMAAFTRDEVFECGGNLITPQHILFAAHCIYNKNANEMRDPDTSFRFLLEDDQEKGWDGENHMNVSKIIIHPSWDIYSKNYLGDLAIAVLDTPAKISKEISPICLNTKANPIGTFTGRDATVAGWGYHERNSTESSDHLNKVQVRIVNQTLCQNHQNKNFKQMLSETSFCAGQRDLTGPCNGDSGGGLFLQQNDDWLLLGIVSAALGVNGICDLSDYVLYTDVGKFDEWIKQVIFETYKLPGN